MGFTLTHVGGCDLGRARTTVARMSDTRSTPEPQPIEPPLPNPDPQPIPEPPQPDEPEEAPSITYR